MNRILLLLLVVPFIGYGQCKKKERKDFNGSKYHGCLNDIGQPHGEGTLKFDAGKYDGEWKNGVMNGNGELTTNYINNQGYEEKTTYNGFFVEGKKSGDGVEIIKFTKGKVREIWTFEGEFKSDIQFNGNKTKEYESGEIIIFTIKEGEVIKQRSNRKNYYNEDDIIGNTSKSIVDLERRNNHYFIDFYINGVSCEGIFDTGAFGLKIGNRLYQRLISEGVKVHDLNMEAITEGIGGISNGGFVKFDEIKVGEYTVKDVIATFSLDQDYTLIGTQFFEKFYNVQWDMKEETLKLYR
jgi:predicted aspartyl protease